MRVSTRALLLLGGGLLATTASAFTIGFDDLSPGTTLGSQYAALGVIFSANGGSGATSTGEPWATNTDMTVVSLITGVDGEDYGALGSPSLVSNHVLRRYLDWYGEDGDPSFRIDLATPASQISITFAGLGSAAFAPDTRLWAYAGSLLVGSAVGSWPDESVGQLTLGVVAPAITAVVVAPGSYRDWVAVDNISIAPVPEPGRWALMLLGIAGLGVLSRRRLEPGEHP